MNIVLVLIPLSLILVVVAVWAFFWAVGSGQFDDLDSPAYRILLDDDERKRGDGEQRKPKDDDTGRDRDENAS